MNWSGEGGMAGLAISVMVGIAWALDQLRKRWSESQRQIKNDNNAADWQDSLLEENKELRQRLDAALAKNGELARSLDQLSGRHELLEYRYNQLEEDFSRYKRKTGFEESK